MTERTTERMTENMTRADVFRLSRKGWMWLAFPGIFFWIGAVSLGFFAVDGTLEIYEQDASPVVVTASVSNETVDFSAVEGILGWSNVYEISGTLRIAGYSQACTVIGIDENLISADLKEGMGYPQESVMPYLLVNEALVQEMKVTSARMIANGDDISKGSAGSGKGSPSEGESPSKGSSTGGGSSTSEGSSESEYNQILTKSAEFVYGDGRQVPCKISGILKNEEEGEAPKVYMSVSSARSLLQSQEGAGETKQVWFRIRNAGMYEKVQRALSGLQVHLEDLKEEMIWSGKFLKLRTTMLYICALISGLAAWTIFSQSLRMDLIKNEKEYHYIETTDAGFSDFYRNINRYRKLRFFLTGIVLGAIIYMCWPVFMAMLTIS